jgi:hypothetical protein
VAHPTAGGFDYRSVTYVLRKAGLLREHSVQQPSGWLREAEPSTATWSHRRPHQPHLKPGDLLFFWSYDLAPTDGRTVNITRRSDALEGKGLTVMVGATKGRSHQW